MAEANHMPLNALQYSGCKNNVLALNLWPGKEGGLHRSASDRLTKPRTARRKCDYLISIDIVLTDQLAKISDKPLGLGDGITHDLYGDLLLGSVHVGAPNQHHKRCAGIDGKE
jgi:hypothetical protein